MKSGAIAKRPAARAPNRVTVSDALVAARNEAEWDPLGEPEALLNRFFAFDPTVSRNIQLNRVHSRAWHHHDNCLKRLKMPDELRERLRSAYACKILEEYREIYSDQTYKTVE